MLAQRANHAPAADHSTARPEYVDWDNRVSRHSGSQRFGV
jgi:hypothetical protein